MKIEKRICDVCGAEIADLHPTRFDRVEYVTESRKSLYKKVESYDVCTPCCDKLIDTFKTTKEGK